MAFTGLVVPSQTTIQERTTPGFQGRIFGNLSVLANVTSIVPVIFSWTFANLLGVRFPLGLLGLACLAGFILSKKYGSRFSRAMAIDVGACLGDGIFGVPVLDDGSSLPGEKDVLSPPGPSLL
jgi:hypothetical protein